MHLSQPKEKEEAPSDTRVEDFSEDIFFRDNNVNPVLWSSPESGLLPETVSVVSSFATLSLETQIRILKKKLIALDVGVPPSEVLISIAIFSAALAGLVSSSAQLGLGLKGSITLETYTYLIVAIVLYGVALCLSIFGVLFECFKTKPYATDVYMLHQMMSLNLEQTSENLKDDHLATQLNAYPLKLVQQATRQFDKIQRKALHSKKLERYLRVALAVASVLIGVASALPLAQRSVALAGNATVALV